jgi:hypothetical protein
MKAAIRTDDSQIEKAEASKIVTNYSIIVVLNLLLAIFFFFLG